MEAESATKPGTQRGGREHESPSSPTAPWYEAFTDKQLIVSPSPLITSKSQTSPSEPGGQGLTISCLSSKAQYCTGGLNSLRCCTGGEGALTDKADCQPQPLH